MNDQREEAKIEKYAEKKKSGPIIKIMDKADTEVLIEGIESCKIGALGIDVLEHETGIYHQDLRSNIIRNRSMAYLRQFPNVTMTQHIAFYTEEAVAGMVDGGVRSLVEMIEGRPCALEILAG